MDDYGWKITRDYLNKKGNTFCRAGCYTKGFTELDKTKYIKFRCKDDDGNTYYSGVMVDNDNCDAQEDILNWSMNDAGCVLVEVKRGDKWVAEIG